MTVTTTGITATIKQLEQEVNDEISKELRVNSLSAFSDLVKATPVDEGTARQSWSIAVNDPATHNAAEGNIGSKSLSQEIKANDNIYITNGVPYIRELNNGHSKQAAKNFIEAALVNNFPGDEIGGIE